jgi:ATP-dependent RNA helicase RhlE
VEGISHVINFDMPDTADAYIHRIGRTGRAEHTGDAFTLINPDDGDMVRTLEKIMGQALPRLTLADFDYNVPAPVQTFVSNQGRPGTANRHAPLPARTQSSRRPY